MYVFPLILPPLRNRSEDIPTLIEHFARQVCIVNGWKPVSFTAEAISALQAHAWPGNVRELRNVVERLILLADSEEVGLGTVQLVVAPNSHGTAHLVSTFGPLSDRVQGFEREVILAELKRNHYHITNTAKALGLERSHLYKKAEQVGIDLRAVREEPKSAAGAR